MSSYAAEGTQDAEVADDPAPAPAPAPAVDDRALATTKDAAPTPGSDDVPAQPTASGDTPPTTGDATSENDSSENDSPRDSAPEHDSPEIDDAENNGPDDGTGNGPDDTDNAANGEASTADYDGDDDDGDYDGDYGDYGGDYGDGDRGDDGEAPCERPKVSKLAVVALITGVIPLVPIALITGIAALISVRRSGKRGQGMAVSALFFAVGWVALAGGIGAIAHFTHIFQKQVKVVYVYKAAPVFKLKEGDCINTSNGRQVTIVSCTSPHDAEVFGTFTLPAGPWPGTAAIRKESGDGCSARLTSYINPQLTISLTQTYVYPNHVDWTGGTRTVVCEVQPATGQLSQSVRGTG